MGLSVEVGMLADLLEHDPEGAEDLANELEFVNAALVEHQLPVHSEPRTLPLLTNRASCTSFPYSYLHYLSRVYAHVLNQPEWIATPVTLGEDPTHDQLVVDESLEFRSHLLVHSDCDGFYVPIDFVEPIFADKSMRGGGIIGSTQRLIAELVLVAPSLGILLDSAHALTDEEAQKINISVEEEVPLSIELMVWLCLYESARLSIEFKSAICFC